jgi:hypothetical protein
VYRFSTTCPAEQEPDLVKAISLNSTDRRPPEPRRKRADQRLFLDGPTPASRESSVILMASLSLLLPSNGIIDAV